MAMVAGCALVPSGATFASDSTERSKEEEAFLDDLERQGCLFFWEQASAKTGQILDRARNDQSDGKRDARRMASTASTGFGLTALCIADRRGYTPHAQIIERVRTLPMWKQGSEFLAQNSHQLIHRFYFAAFLRRGRTSTILRSAYWPHRSMSAWIGRGC
jgi:hypothetical protein